jgi:tetratricopeptide (TPR) repeat protein
MRAIFILLVTVAMAACRGAAPDRSTPASSPAPESQPAASPSGPAGLRTGFGNHHHPIATSNPDAQRFFDLGFDFVFGFNHEEAVKSFMRASELDPKAAMPHWGIAWALGPNYNLDVDDERAKQANAAMAKALALSEGGPASERAYIEAMAIRFPNTASPDRASLARRYADAMGRVSKQFPDDLDAATLYAESLMNLRAWKLWSLDGKPAERTEEIISVLESVLARDPNHIGANHYLIHTVEASPSPGRALASAERLGTLAPAAGHLVHMPAHVFARTGDHAAAARANSGGAAADREYFKTASADSFYAMAYYAHNLHFLADSEMMQGRLAAARTAAADLAKALAPHTAMMPMVESMIAMQHSVLMRFGQADELIASASPPADHPVEVAWWHFARGVAYAQQGKAAEAAAERTALVEGAGKVPESALFGGTGLESAANILKLATKVLDARIASARRAPAEAIRLWREAVAMADTVPYDEPPIFFYPVRESLGAALLVNGDAAGAERVFRDDLRKFPRNARSLFGLHEALLKQGKAADAEWVKRQFDEVWKNADTTLSIDRL